MFGNPRGDSEKNISDATNNRWGWYGEIRSFQCTANMHTFDMHAGSSRNMIEHGTKVKTVTVVLWIRLRVRGPPPAAQILCEKKTMAAGMAKLFRLFLHIIQCDLPRSVRLNGSNAEEMVRWALDNKQEARRIAERATLFMYVLVYHPDAASADHKIKEEMARRYRTLWH